MEIDFLTAFLTVVGGYLLAETVSFIINIFMAKRRNQKPPHFSFKLSLKKREKEIDVRMHAKTINDSIDMDDMKWFMSSIATQLKEKGRETKEDSEKKQKIADPFRAFPGAKNKKKRNARQILKEQNSEMYENQDRFNDIETSDDESTTSSLEMEAPKFQYRKANIDKRKRKQKGKKKRMNAKKASEEILLQSA